MKKVVTALLLLLLVSVLAGNASASGIITGTTEAFRTIQTESLDGSVLVIRADSQELDAYEGLSFFNGDSVKVGEKSEMLIVADSDKHLFAEEKTNFAIEAGGFFQSSKSRIHLEEGSVLCWLDNKLKGEEFFEIETPSATMSVRGTVFRVSILDTQNDVDLTMIQVYEGSVEIVILETGATVVLNPGECALVQSSGEIIDMFVLDDQLDETFWDSNRTEEYPIRPEGSGSPVLTIPYEKIPDRALEVLVDIIDSGRDLCVPRDFLENVLTTGHNYVTHVIVPAACTEAGLARLDCTICHEYYQQYIPALGHSVVTDKAAAATCTKTGLTKGEHCSVCGEVLTPQETVPVLGHTAVTDKAASATCTEDGLTEGAHCSVCNKVLTAQKVIPAKGHTSVTDKAVAATCTETGLTEGAHCSVCDAVLTAQEVIPAKGHTSVTDKAVAATCTETGLTEGAHCSVCDAVLTAQEVIPAKGHTSVADKAVAATCTETGLTEGAHCSVCDAVLTAQEVIPAKGHTSVTDKAVAATCTETGLTEGEHCSVCDAVLTAQEVIPAKGHTSVTDKAVAATCTETGLTEGAHCSVCSTVITAQKEIPALGHTAETDRAVAATCTEAGLTEGAHCSVCNAVLTAQKAIPATGHTAVTDPAVAETCTEDGLTEGSHCSVCNTVLTAQTAIPAGHLPSGREAKRYPLEKIDTYCYTMVSNCSRCGEELTSTPYPHVSDNGADPSYGLDVDCYSIEYLCEDCGFQMETKNFPHEADAPLYTTDLSDYGIYDNIDWSNYCHAELVLCQHHSECGHVVSWELKPMNAIPVLYRDTRKGNLMAASTPDYNDDVQLMDDGTLRLSFLYMIYNSAACADCGARADYATDTFNIQVEAHNSPVDGTFQTVIDSTTYSGTIPTFLGSDETDALNLVTMYTQQVFDARRS